MFKDIENKDFGLQSFFSLVVILLAATAVPHLLVGEDLASRYGVGTAVSSILVGNLLLWLIAIGVIAMMEQMHIDAIENIKKYFGKFGGLLAAIILLLIFLNRYAFQLNFLVHWIDQNVWDFEDGFLIRIGAAAGLLVALLSVGGLRLLKYLSFLGLPLFLFCLGYSLFFSEKHIVWEGSWRISFPAVLESMALTFPKIVMLPTLFRFSKSKEHSYLALALFVLFLAILEVVTIWADFSVLTSLFNIYVYFFVFVCVLKMVCCNLFNIYLASACWEAIVQRFSVAKEQTIIGLCGTLVYTFMQILEPAEFAQNVTGAFLASLGVVLLISYLMRLMIQHRPRPLEKRISVSAWIFGCVTAVFCESDYIANGTSSLVVAMSSSFLFFLGVLFLEETIWAIRAKWEQVKG